MKWKNWDLRLTVGAVRVAEEATGKSLGELLSSLANGSALRVSDVLELVVAAAREGERDAVRRALEESTPIELVGIVRPLLAEAGLAGEPEGNG